MVVGNMQIKLGEVWTCGSRDQHANRQTHCDVHTDMADRHATLITIGLLRFHSGAD